MTTRDELGRIAWDAVPLAIDPVDGWRDVETADWVEIEAALEPGPPTWEEVQRFWPDVAESYRRLAEAVATDVRGDQAEVLAAADALAAALDEVERQTFDGERVENHPVWDAQERADAARAAYQAGRSRNGGEQ